MITLRSSLFFVLLIGTLSFLGGEAKACDCEYGGSLPCYEYWRSDAVFQGTVVSQQNLDEDNDGFSQRLARLAIEQAFKGITGSQVDIVTGRGGGECGYPFKDGQRYLVYAFRDRKDTSRWHTSICTRTRPFSEAGEDLAYFSALPKVGSGGTIRGRVIRRSTPLNDESRFTLTPLQEIEITIEGEGRHLQAKSDGDGRYQVPGLAAGSYTVRANLPENVSLYSQLDIQVVDRGCAVADFYALVDGQISGKVVDSEGSPVPRIRVDVVAVKDGRQAASQGRWSYTDPYGGYTLNSLPPGSYYLGVNLTGAFCRYPRVYYPDSADTYMAKPITLSEAQKLDKRDITVPFVRTDLEAEVEVRWPDGSPADTVAIVLHSQGPSYHVTTDRASRVRPGVYRIKGVKGCSYWVEAFTYGHPGEPGGGTQWHDEALIDDSVDLSKPIQLILSKPGLHCLHRRQ